MKGKKKKKGYRKVTYPAAIRMAKIIDSMPSHALGMRVSTMCERYDISEQTVMRYVKSFSETFVTDEGEPQFAIENRGGEKWLVRHYAHAGESASPVYKVIPLYLAIEFFNMLGSHNIFSEILESFYGEVESRVYSEHKRMISDLPRKLFAAPFAPRDYSAQDWIISELMKALLYQNVINMKYRPGGRGRPRNYTLEPLTLLYNRGGLYLLAKFPDGEKPIFFSIERIKEIAVTKEKFDYPGDYHPARMLDGAFGIFTGEPKLFRLKFSRYLKDYITARTWHRTQRFEFLKGGSFVMTMEVADTEEVRAWIRSFGDSVKIIRVSKAVLPGEKESGTASS